MKDPIVAEIRKIRDEHAAKFNYDLDAIFKDLKKTEHKLKDRLVRLKPKLICRKTGT